MTEHQFRDKNRDELPPEAVELMAQSKFEFIRALFAEDVLSSAQTTAKGSTSGGRATKKMTSEFLSTNRNKQSNYFLPSTVIDHVSILLSTSCYKI